MNNKQLRSNKLDLQLSLAETASIQSRRKMELSLSGAFLIEDVLEIKGPGEMIFVTCDTWLIQLFELKSGEFSFMRGGESILPHTTSFGIFYPPFAMMKACFKDLSARWTGVAATEALPAEFTAVPMMFETDVVRPPESVTDVEEILNSSYRRQTIEVNPNPSWLSIKAKKLIDENYLIRPSIARIAARLDVTHEHLTRQFKRDFGLSPSHYCRQVGIADAMFRLARGEEIVDLSQEVGYNDLSRFYKQFRKATMKTPGYCQAPRKSNPAR